MIAMAETNGVVESDHEPALIFPAIRHGRVLTHDAVAAPEAVQRVLCRAHRGAAQSTGIRAVAEETATSITYNGSSYATMMATPADLVDFAVGFSLSERVIEELSDVISLDIVAHRLGIELRFWLKPQLAAAFADRRRRLVGPTGCGLCGVESLAGALPPLPRVSSGPRMTPDLIAAALSSFTSGQIMHRETGALHAAGFYVPGSGLLSLREDIGRHNALDKLAGDLAQRQVFGATGVVLLTSRVSVEMVQKTATLGAVTIIAISAPTALAIRAANEAGITLVALARADGFEVFSGDDRLAP
jgi:FdhD protein